MFQNDSRVNGKRFSLNDKTQHRSSRHPAQSVQELERTPKRPKFPIQAQIVKQLSRDLSGVARGCREPSRATAALEFGLQVRRQGPPLDGVGVHSSQGNAS